MPLRLLCTFLHVGRVKISARLLPTHFICYAVKKGDIFQLVNFWKKLQRQEACKKLHIKHLNSNLDLFSSE